MNSMDIAWVARVRLNLLSEFMDGAVYGLGVLHPPSVLAYPPGGQYHVWVSHKVEQQGKFPMAQTDRPPAYFYLLLGWVYINISPPKRGGFHAGGIVIIPRMISAFAPRQKLSKICGKSSLLSVQPLFLSAI